MKRLSLLFLLFTIPAFSNSQNVQYGSVLVDDILSIEEGFVFRCNITQWPAIIGQDIPVHINQVSTVSLYKLKSLDIESLKKKIDETLKQIFQEADRVILKNIQRANTFGIIADVEIDGVNLADILVEKQLAEKVSFFSEAVKPGQKQLEPTQQQQRKTEQIRDENKQGGYIASKSSKVFHRVDCRYAKTITSENQIHYISKQEALDSGKRPCKSCNP